MIFSCSKHPKDITPAANYEDYASILEGDCVEISEEFANPQEALKHAMQSLKQDQWQSSVSALIKLMHISRIQPELLDSNMPRIYRTMCRSFEHLFAIHLLFAAMKHHYIAVCYEIRGRMSLELSAR